MGLQIILLLFMFMFGSAPLCLLCSGVAGPPSSSCIERERRALLHIRAGLGRPDGWLSSWSSDDGDCCRWSGVGCSNTTGHVVKLNLRRPVPIEVPELIRYGDYSQPLTEYPGKLNPSLVELTHLQHLDLSFNNFNFTPIPDFVGSLVQLTHLNLSFTNFCGSVPHHLGNLSRLRLLDLQQMPEFEEYNSSTGLYTFKYTLSSGNLHWLSQMSSLRYLDLSAVDLSLATAWLQDINMLPRLSVLLLERTRLHSLPVFLPHHLNFTSSLTTLDLSESGFLFTTNAATTLPYWLFNITSLQHLGLHRCGLSGEIPPSIQNLGGLNYLDLGDNMIRGELPESLGNLRKLQYLYLYDNRITGNIPDTLGNMTHLTDLYLYGNRITGSIPDTLGNMTNLTGLYLSLNRITGSIPDTLGNMINLESLRLDQNRFTGSIPDTLGNMTNLTILDLSRNRITGSIPDTLGNMTNLTHLYLGSNSIAGSVPDTLGNMNSLTDLDLSYNRITGSIPVTLGNMAQLKYLDLSYNIITGSIPDTLENMTRLTELDLSYNIITGCIPNSFGNMANLADLSLSGNKITGEIPKSIGGLSKLEGMYLDNNQIRGNIPNTIGNLSQLEVFSIYDNMINGEIPDTIGNLSNVEQLYLSNNSISGEIPMSMGQLCNLKYLILSHNNLGGEITWLVDGLSKCTQNNNSLGQDTDGGYDQNGLSALDLSNNNLKGRVPPSLGQLYKLRDLIVHSNCLSGAFPELGPSINIVDLSNNSFSGPIPPNLGAAGVGLQILSASHNHLNESIPPSICKFYNLEVLHLFNNNLLGRFPKCQNKLVKPTEFFTKNLQSLNLRNNAITGRFPSVLKQCENLTTLDLSGNGLSGEIPTWIGEYMKSLKVFILRSNNFTGTVPPQLSGLVALQVLDLSHNSLSGRLPPSFWNFTAMSTVDIHINQSTPYNNISQYYSESIIVITKGLITEYTKLLTIVTSVDISANYFSGEIPDGLVNLYGLRSLNMSTNHFKGKIPENIGYLQLLESLDLSKNDLAGQIPASISTMHFLSHLNLSNNNLSGRIPSGNQLQTFDDPSIYNGNSDLCGWPLPQCHVEETPPEQVHRSGDDEKERKEYRVEIIWICVSSIVGFAMGFWSLIITMMLKPSIKIAYFRSFDRICDWCYVKLAVNFNRLKSIATKTD